MLRVLQIIQTPNTHQFHLFQNVQLKISNFEEQNHDSALSSCKKLETKPVAASPKE